MSEESQRINYAGGTDKGLVREQNEDSILLCTFDHSEVSLLVVADGVGGHEGGALASKLAVESLKDTVAKAVLQAHSGGGYAENWTETTLQHAIDEANKELFVQQKEQPQYANMATTVVALLINNGEIALSHLGDSRCYQYKDSKLIQITEDHTVLQQLLNEGKIDQQLFEALPMHNMISKALGITEENEIYTKKFELEAGTDYLLCSDGLTNCLTDEQIVDVLLANENLSDCVDQLITHANDNGGVDNISVVILRSIVSSE